MNFSLPTELLEATRLAKTGQLTQATAVLQRLLGAGMPASRDPVQARHGPPTIDGVVHGAETTQATLAPPVSTTFSTDVREPSFRTKARTTKRALPAALRDLIDKASRGGSHLPGNLGDVSPGSVSADVPDGAQFLACTFGNQAGSRPYKLYVPSGYRGQPVPLVVMLHGCTQCPDDFAAGTRMNAAAEEYTCLIVYPGQTSSANMQKCWNWFSVADQQRDAGEPSLIAGITRAVMREYAVDPLRVFIAGLSAGGAAAAIMGDAYPDLYAAIGVHSGLACGAAHDMPSAFTAMQGNGGNARRPAPTGAARSKPRIVPAIVFHGDKDTTVNPRNADSVVAQSSRGTSLRRRIEEGQVAGGLAYSRILHAGPSGETLVEQWVIHGAGHGWSGGSPVRSYTLPRGPDATREMVRFFLEHPFLD